MVVLSIVEVLVEFVLLLVSIQLLFVLLSQGVVSAKAYEQLNKSIKNNILIIIFIFYYPMNILVGTSNRTKNMLG